MFPKREYIMCPFMMSTNKNYTRILLFYFILPVFSFLYYVLLFFVHILFSEQYFLDDLVLKENVAMKYKSHKEIYEDNLRICCQVLHKIRELQRSGKEDIDLLL